ncbi:MAG: PAS domain-containing protein [Hyphomicrobiaceae bacterium]|nr:MAG: PAS domain-containing protein [Hyphomicrobiaceae bacterium]
MSGTILVIGEDGPRRQAKASALRGAGYTVEEAGTAAAALELLMQVPIDLAMVDIELPDMHGFELRRAIKATYPSILVLKTSGTFAASVGPVIELGADAYLAEPMEDTELVATVRALLRMRDAETARTETELRFAQFAEASPDVLWIYDAGRNAFDYVSPAFEELFGRKREDVLCEPSLWLSSVHAGDRIAVAEIVRRCLAGERVSIEYRIVRPDGSERWLKDVAFPIREGVGAVRRVAGLARDVAGVKEVEAQRELLIRELNHRVKNTLAIVQSLAGQSRLAADSLEEFERAFTGRLHALAKAHDLLTRTNWKGATLEEIAREAVAPFGEAKGAGSRIACQGPVVWLDPSTAVTLSLALHELATNAAKFGALSNAHGQVDIRWAADDEAAPTAIDLSWTESGGPQVKQPARRGFGSMLIERALGYEAEGDVKLEFLPQGLAFQVRFPLSSKVSLD